MNATKTTPAVAPVYSPAQADMLATVARATLALAASPLAHAVTLALAEIALPGMVTSNGRDMAPHRRDVLADITARTSASTAKAQFSRGLFLWEKYEADLRECADGSDAVPAMMTRLAGRDIRDQWTLDKARGTVKEKPKLSAVEKAQAALDKAREKEGEEIASAQRAAEYASPAARLARIIADIAPGGFNDADMAAIATALRNAPKLAQDAGTATERDATPLAQAA